MTYFMTVLTGWKHACIDAWMYVCMDECMDAWMDGCMDGWMHGRVDAFSTAYYDMTLHYISLLTMSQVRVEFVIEMTPPYALPALARPQRVPSLKHEACQ